ncbi:4a-hydroxytetrahydrobiopterin dehydratase [Streptomyces sp. TRM43335]|uniref:Putative pterin-4-alpha-carbinolamine dehydratase n=1 Tax=Streptomyces taklimakanensis TaxID=2569853 RepID=A0A6G2BH88_9ACTN|nr:4a-hydroxytetrahydrobiopterin dehydratase [Streptomyces taklimakanensis]MTE21628.1 4a-hydroxytetrahydrobiopterin dehydratase [Streptomyces taklimakanensis]
MAPRPLSQEEIDAALAELPGWESDGDRLRRTYSFAGHLPAAAMVIHVARIQDELDHHADLLLGYNTLAVSVNTHSAGGRITERDVELARRIAAVAPAHDVRS